MQHRVRAKANLPNSLNQPLKPSGPDPVHQPRSSPGHLTQIQNLDSGSGSESGSDHHAPCCTS